MVYQFDFDAEPFRKTNHIKFPFCNSNKTYIKIKELKGIVLNLTHEKLLLDVSEVISKNFPALEGVSFESPLIGQNQIDSLQALKLIFCLEKHFNIRFNPDELNPTNFKNIQTIVHLIEKKQLK